ncbi:MAG TPA: DNA polymerase/3'-5' exonuclease PolX [Actinomycetota bacterium]
MPSTNETVEALFAEWAELLQLAGADAFRVRAYEKAARSIGGFSKDLRDLDDKGLRAIPSVGASMAARIREYLETGTLHELEDLREQVPAGLREMMRIPSLGPKKAILLHETLGISTVDELAGAARDGKLRGIKGLGQKTEENLLRGIQNLREHGGRILIDAAMDAAVGVIEALRGLAEVDQITYAGSLRRMRDTIGDIDILVASANAAPIMDSFAGLSSVKEVLAHGETKTSVLTDTGLQIDLRTVPADAWGAALIYFTGSKSHNIKIREIAVRRGWKLSEWGLFKADTGKKIAAETEEEVYEALGLPWIPPTMREDTGEIEAAFAGTLPTVVERRDIRGDLHSHTNLTDGLAPLEEMLAAAAAAGYSYYVVTDHAEGLPMTGMDRGKALAQRKRIATLQKKYPKMTILHGSELNIAKDGSVDYDPAFLAGFDLLVASVHSMFRLPRDEQTARIIRAMENPFINVIGHPTGRLIGRREPIDVDFESICNAAVRTGTALEVNSFPDRMDLRDEHVRWAIERGVTIAIDTDSHAPKHLEHLRFGVATAQRGWARKTDVLNARTLKQLRTFVEKKRPG